MSDAIVVTYQEIPITYVEGSNEWRFELRGRERRVVSLTVAKAAIDAPPPKDKKAFVRFDAWLDGYNSWAKVVVTSIAESNYYGTYYWIVKADKQRSKERGASLYAMTPENNAAVEQIQLLEAERTRLPDAGAKASFVNDFA